MKKTTCAVATKFVAFLTTILAVLSFTAGVQKAGAMPVSELVFTPPFTNPAVRITTYTGLSVLTNSPNYDLWCSKFVTYMKTGLSKGAVTNSSVPTNFYTADVIGADYVTTTTATSSNIWLAKFGTTQEKGNSVVFGVVVESASGRFYATNLHCSQWSMDSAATNGLFGKEETFTNMAFSPRCIGVIYGDFGNNFNTTYITSGSTANTAVNALIFVGSFAKTMRANDENTLSSNRGWFNANCKGLIGTWSITTPSGTFSVSRFLPAINFATNPKWAIVGRDSENMWIGVDQDAKIMWSPELGSPTRWTEWGNLMAHQELRVPYSVGDVGFFKAVPTITNTMVIPSITMKLASVSSTFVPEVEDIGSAQ